VKKIVGIVAGIGLASILTAATAIAADMPTKAAAPSVAAPIYDWTGSYAGVNAGGVWGSSSDNWIADPIIFNPSIPATGTHTFEPDGFIGGGQLGYNYQMNNLVLGGEADMNYTGLSASRFAPIPPPFANTVGGSVTSNWLATFRGRLGIANNGLLLYLTGGLAVANVKYLDGTVFNRPIPATNSSSSTQTGWIIGGGAEYAVSQSWSLKGEYLHVDLGEETNTGINSVVGNIPQISFTHHLTENIARLGLNYRLH
jgi:outer membrane immunogenic protein